MNDEMTLPVAFVKALAASVFYGPFANGMFLAGARLLRYGPKVTARSHPLFATATLLVVTYRRDRPGVVKSGDGRVLGGGQASLPRWMWLVYQRKSVSISAHAGGGVIACVLARSVRSFFADMLFFVFAAAPAAVARVRT